MTENLKKSCYNFCDVFLQMLMSAVRGWIIATATQIVPTPMKASTAPAMTVTMATEPTARVRSLKCCTLFRYLTLQRFLSLQTSMNVKQIPITVIGTRRALTLQEATTAPVTLASLEMGPPAVSSI